MKPLNRDLFLHLSSLYFDLKHETVGQSFGTVWEWLFSFLSADDAERAHEKFWLSLRRSMFSLWGRTP